MASPKDLFLGKPIAVASIAGELWTLSIGLPSVFPANASNGISPGLVCLARAERRGEDDSDWMRPRSMLDKARWMVPGEGRPSSLLVSAAWVTVFKSARVYNPPLELSVKVFATALTREGL